MHNLWFYLSLMREAREAIMAGRYTRFRARVEKDRSSTRDTTAPTEL
jgi:queuine/archaeosine tRNA-ribosyltransferase